MRTQDPSRIPQQGDPLQLHTQKRRPKMTNWGLSAPDANTLIGHLLCSARGLREQGFPENSYFPGSSDFSLLRKDTEELISTESCQCARHCIKSQRHDQFRDPSDNIRLSFSSTSAPNVLSSSVGWTSLFCIHPSSTWIFQIFCLFGIFYCLLQFSHFSISLWLSVCLAKF